MYLCGIYSILINCPKTTVHFVFFIRRQFIKYRAQKTNSLSNYYISNILLFIVSHPIASTPSQEDQTTAHFMVHAGRKSIRPLPKSGTLWQEHVLQLLCQVSPEYKTIKVQFIEPFTIRATRTSFNVAIDLAYVLLGKWINCKLLIEPVLVLPLP